MFTKPLLGWQTTQTYYRFPYAQYVPVDLMNLLFNQEHFFYNSTLADLEKSYHLLTSIYYKNSLNLTMSANLMFTKPLLGWQTTQTYYMLP
jgi:hypothetical protein